MNEQSFVACAFSLALLRERKRTPGVVTKLVADMPFEFFTHFDEAVDWFSSRHPDQVIPTRDSLEAATDVMAKTVGMDIVPIFYAEEDYPPYLKTVEDAPPVLYVRGNLDLFRRPAGVAVVGTRKASPKGLVIAERIAHHFASHNWTVVSGLALGIDAAAHRGALAANGPTIAVLAHGLHKATPRTNAHLANGILDSGGAWASEFPADIDDARKEFFIQRNRIQIGLSAGSIIVEGEERSGTMAQAEFCIRNRRKLFAVLPDTADELNLVSQLPLMLVRNRGATQLRSKSDYDDAITALTVQRQSLQPA